MPTKFIGDPFADASITLAIVNRGVNVEDQIHQVRSERPRGSFEAVWRGLSPEENVTLGLAGFHVLRAHDPDTLKIFKNERHESDQLWICPGFSHITGPDFWAIAPRLVNMITGSHRCLYLHTDVVGALYALNKLLDDVGVVE